MASAVVVQQLLHGLVFGVGFHADVRAALAVHIVGNFKVVQRIHVNSACNVAGEEGRNEKSQIQSILVVLINGINGNCAAALRLIHNDKIGPGFLFSDFGNFPGNQVRAASGCRGDNQVYIAVRPTHIRCFFPRLFCISLCFFCALSPCFCRIACGS